MNPIRVDTELLNARASELEKLQDELARLSETLGSISSSLTWQIPGSRNIKGSLDSKMAQLDLQHTRAGAMASGLRSISLLYDMTERKNAFGSVAGPAAAAAAAAAEAAANAASGDSKSALDEYGTYEKDDAFNEKLNLPEQKKYKGKQINEDEKFYDKKGTILEKNLAEAKAEATWIEGEASGKSKYAQGTAGYKVATAEAHAGVTAGMYVYEKDKDGNVTRIFSPGVSAAAGASVALATASASGRIGLGEDNNMLGVYGKGEVKAVTAEAKAEVAFNRKEIHASASAEADLVKAEGSAGVTVLGTDIGVKGAVKVGVGAHADIGYTDGKFKVDVGAAVGVGVDLGFEIDVGGTVDAVSSVCESVIDFFTW
jgi:hypothetical protein